MSFPEHFFPIKNRQGFLEVERFLKNQPEHYTETLIENCLEVVSVGETTSPDVFIYGILNSLFEKNLETILLLPVYKSSIISEVILESAERHFGRAAATQSKNVWLKLAFKWFSQ